MSSVLNQFSAVLTYIILALVILSLLLWPTVGSLAAAEVKEQINALE